MKTKPAKYYTVIVVALIIVVGMFVVAQRSLKEIKKQIAEHNTYFVETPLKIEYDSLCKVEDENNIYFPGNDVKYAKLTKNDF
ncbi:hypothetical protein GCM10009122_24250 [Fulvivirga kasyanovii]|uniref:Uncharacterized protein n=1 Tax=Fulvivirga kasyanovii TaxID=396812 RepID=A0ABW9RM47_9BACT|nr:hypothetical protein [Fulvivirga kasyanovii]MTI23970.1 hypothetical protein [Fulvivirga kasyanovii]